jgi:ribosomal protein S13
MSIAHKIVGDIQLCHDVTQHSMSSKALHSLQASVSDWSVMTATEMRRDDDSNGTKPLTCHCAIQHMDTTFVRTLHTKHTVVILHIVR